MNDWVPASTLAKSRIISSFFDKRGISSAVLKLVATSLFEANDPTRGNNLSV